MATRFGASGLLAVNKPLFMRSTNLVYAVKSGLQLAHSEEHGSPIHFKKIKCGDHKAPLRLECTRIPTSRVRVFSDGQLCTYWVGSRWFDVPPCVGGDRWAFVRPCTIVGGGNLGSLSTDTPKIYPSVGPPLR